MAVIKKLQSKNQNITIEHVPIDSVSCHPKNPVIHDAENLEKIKRSLRDFGQRKTIAVWNNLIIAGNGTWTAAKAIGWKTIAISRCDHLTESQAEAYILADNKASDGHKYDDELTFSLVRSIQQRGDIELESTGLSTLELEPLLAVNLPDVPDYLQDLDGSDIPDSDIIGGLSAKQRIIIAYDTQRELKELVSMLGLNYKEGKVVYTMQDVGYEAPF